MGIRPGGLKAGMLRLVALLAVLCLFAGLYAAWPGGGAAGASGGEAEIRRDPLGRLPASPEEAHRRLEERALGWPGEGEESDPSRVEAASVAAGLRVAIPYDTVEGFTTHADAKVRVELVRGAQTWTVDARTNAYKWFYADFSAVAADIQSGDRVRVTDLAGGAAAVVNCTLTGSVNVAGETVSGNAPSGNSIDIYIRIPGTYYGDVPPGAAHKKVAAAGGKYSASFPGTNIRDGDAAVVFSTDAAGHQVMNLARTGLALVVYPQYDEVMGYCTPGTSVTVKAGSATRAVGSAADGFFDAWFLDHDISPGEKVSANLGGSRSITVGDIAATADPWSNVVRGTAPPNRPMRITMDTYRGPVTVETSSDAAGAYSFDFTGLYTITGIEVFNVSWYNDAGDCVVYEFQTYSWYMPEGYTGAGFDEWVLVMNPSGQTVRARVIYQTLTGPVEGPLIDAPPGSRVNVHVNEWVPERHVSTMVTAIDGGQMMAERAMYMYNTPDGKWGSHDSIGILTPSSLWYLPEGATYFGFDEWVLVQNPNKVEVSVKVQFLAAGGVAREFELPIGASSRYSIHANDYVPGTEFSTRVECLTRDRGEVLPVFAERAMYMATADGKRGAHDSIGLSTPGPEWYLPEGTTRPGFDEWVLVMNPNDAPTNVRATFLTPDGVGGTRDIFMAPNSRGTIHVNEFINDKDVSTVVTSLEGAGILAERAMYMDTSDGKRGAHDSIGAYQTSTYWYLPEGTTRPGFDEWVLIQNPNHAEVKVRVTLLGPGGPVKQMDVAMKPDSRFTVHVNELVNDLDVSTVVESVGSEPAGILAERAMYMWTFDNKQGAHDSLGIPAFQ